jgi:Icc-related predicted phosphoesterase
VGRNPLKRLDELFSSVVGPKIFLTHIPPYGNKLDKINYPGSPMHGKYMGVKLYNYVDKKYDPVLHICGHIHESQGKIRVGRTVVINTGYGGDGQFAVIDIEKNNKININFVK